MPSMSEGIKRRSPFNGEVPLSTKDIPSFDSQQNCFKYIMTVIHRNFGLPFPSLLTISISIHATMGQLLKTSGIEMESLPLVSSLNLEILQDFEKPMEPSEHTNFFRHDSQPAFDIHRRTKDDANPFASRNDSCTTYTEVNKNSWHTTANVAEERANAFSLLNLQKSKFSDIPNLHVGNFSRKFGNNCKLNFVAGRLSNCKSDTHLEDLTFNKICNLRQMSDGIKHLKEFCKKFEFPKFSRKLGIHKTFFYPTGRLPVFLCAVVPNEFSYQCPNVRWIPLHCYKLSQIDAVSAFSRLIVSQNHQKPAKILCLSQAKKTIDNCVRNKFINFHTSYKKCYRQFLRSKYYTESLVLFSLQSILKEKKSLMSKMDESFLDWNIMNILGDVVDQVFEAENTFEGEGEMILEGHTDDLSFYDDQDDDVLDENSDTDHLDESSQMFNNFLNNLSPREFEEFGNRMIWEFGIPPSPDDSIFETSDSEQVNEEVEVVPPNSDLDEQ